jgi:hypothetical protein
MFFLALPAKIRCQVYSIIAIPDAAPLSDYRGLYLSCHQVKDELDHEGARVFGAYLRHLNSNFENARLTIPSSFPEMQHIHLTEGVIDGNIVGYWNDQRLFNKLHVKSLTIDMQHNPRTSAAHFQLVELIGNHSIAAEHLPRRIVVVLPFVTRGRAIWWMKLAQVFRRSRTDCSFRWSLTPGEGVRAIWERKVSRVLQEETSEAEVVRTLQGLQLE